MRGLYFLSLVYEQQPRADKLIPSKSNIDHLALLCCFKNTDLVFKLTTLRAQRDENWNIKADFSQKTLQIFIIVWSILPVRVFSLRFIIVFSPKSMFDTILTRNCLSFIILSRFQLALIARHIVNSVMGQKVEIQQKILILINHCSPAAVCLTTQTLGTLTQPGFSHSVSFLI